MAWQRSSFLVLFVFKEVKFYCNFFSSELRLKFFWTTRPPLSNNKWLWKLSFARDLVMFLNEFPKLQGKTAFIRQTHTVVKSFWQQMKLFESQAMSGCIIHSRAVKLKQAASSPFPQMCSKDSFELTVLFQQHFLDLSASAKKFPHFKINLIV